MKSRIAGIACQLGFPTKLKNLTCLFKRIKLRSIGTNRHFVTGVTNISATQTNLICKSWMDIKKSV